MKIGITGYTGVGKSDLAERLKLRRENDTYLIDGYVPDLEGRVNVAFGHYASNLGNVQVALERYNSELAAWDKGGDEADYITVGTLIDTLAYAALYSQRDTNNAAEQARVQVTMEFLGMLYIDTFTYDHLFVITGSENDEYDWHMQYALRLFNTDHTILTGTADEQLQQVVDVLEADETTTPE